eukprot:761213-Hanusia_phi.AAC.1
MGAGPGGGVTESAGEPPQLDSWQVAALAAVGSDRASHTLKVTVRCRLHGTVRRARPTVVSYP